MILKRYPLVVYLSFLFFVGCRKDDDNNPPTIVFDLPAVGATYDYGDIIQVKANVKDDERIDFIRITVSDASNNEYLQVLNLTSSSNEKQIATSLEHNDRYLESGTYYVKITAGDGTNEFTAFREIYLHALPVKLDRIFVIRQNASSSIEMDSLSADGDIVSFAFLNGRYERGAIDSRNSTFGFAETFYGGITSVDMNSMAVNDAIGLPASAENGFFNCVIHDPYSHAIYFGGNESQIRKCDHQSVFNIAYLIPGDFIAEHFTLNESFLFVHARNLQSTQQNISVFHRSTGQFFQSLAIDMSVEIQGLEALEDENMVAVATNTGGVAVLKKYNNATNALNDVFTFFDQSPCAGIWPGDDGRFFVAHSNGLVQYNDNFEMVSSGMNVNPLELKYDVVNDRVFVAAGDGLHILNGSATVEIGFYALSNCRDVLLMYNK